MIIDIKVVCEKNNIENVINNGIVIIIFLTETYLNFFNISYQNTEGFC